MKRVNIFFLCAIAATIQFLAACNETSVSSIAIENKELTKVVADSAMMDVELMGSNIELTGKIELTEGECTLSMWVPSGDTLFTVDTIFDYDTIWEIDRIIPSDTVFRIESDSKLDSILKTNSKIGSILYNNLKIKNIIPADTIYTVDSVFVANTFLDIDTLLQYKVLYSKKYVAPVKATVKESFVRKLGRWTFHYEFNKVDDVLPQGSYNFDLQYEN